MNSIWTVRRSATDPKVSGLAAGIARAWNVDPVLVRVGFVVLALSGGIGIVLYLAGWLMIPLEGRQTSYLDDAIPQTRTWSREVKIGVVAVACLIGATALSWLMPFSMMAAIVLAAIWYFGYYRTRPREPRQPRTSRQDGGPGGQSTGSEAEPTRFIEFTEKTPFTEAATAWQQRITEHLNAIRADGPIRTSGHPPSTGPESSGAARQSSWHGGWQPDPQAPRAADPQRPGPRPWQGAAAAAPGAYSGPSGDDLRAADSATASRSDSRPELDPERDAFLAHPDPVGLYSAAPQEAAPVAPVIDPVIARRKRTGRRLTLVSLVVLGLAMTGLGIASSLGVAIGTATYLAVALLVIGLALVVGAVIGRPPVLSFLAVCVALALGTTLAAAPYADKAAVRSYTYTNAAELPASSHLEVGQLTVDLRDLKLDQSRSYQASVDAGRLEVFLPKGVTMDVEGSVDQGMLQLPNQSVKAGSDLTMRWPAPAGAADPVLTIELEVERGQLEVHR